MGERAEAAGAHSSGAGEQSDRQSDIAIVARLLTIPLLLPPCSAGNRVRACLSLLTNSNRR